MFVCDIGEVTALIAFKADLASCSDVGDILIRVEVGAEV